MTSQPGGLREGVFGHWDAPLTDLMPPIPPPVGRPCVYCQQPVQEGDNGAVVASLGVVHRECHYREVVGGIGHYVDHGRYCSGPLGTDAGLTRRLSSLLVWRHVVQGHLVTEQDLRAARGEDPHA